MFQDFDSDVVGFPSIWKKEKSHADSSSQTTEFSTSSGVTQTTTSSNVESQTINNEESQQIQQSDPPGLLEWLQRIGPIMIKELESSKNFSAAFNKKYRDGIDDASESIDSRLIQKIFTLDSLDMAKITPAKQLSISESGDNLSNSVSILGLTWSSSGNVLAVSIGSSRHEGWCDHDGTVMVYKTKRYGSDELDFAYSLTAGGCIADLIFHPSQPPLLATASVSGEVLTWNLQLDGASVPLSPRDVGGSGHVGPVSQLRWLQLDQALACFPNVSQSEQILVSGGSDGLLNVWRSNHKSGILQLLTSYAIHSGRGKDRELVCDITCFDFIRFWDKTTDFANTTDSVIFRDYFVVGCSTGDLITCRTTTARPLPGSERCDPTLPDRPETHNACISSLQFHSQRKGLYLTLAADMELRIFSILQISPLKVICLERSLSTAVWASGESTFIVGGSAKASSDNQPILEAFSSATGAVLDLKGLDVIGNDWKCTMSIAINGHSLSCVTVGDAVGNIYIWNIPFNKIS